MNVSLGQDGTGITTLPAFNLPHVIAVSDSGFWGEIEAQTLRPRMHYLQPTYEVPPMVAPAPSGSAPISFIPASTPGSSVYPTPVPVVAQSLPIVKEDEPIFRTNLPVTVQKKGLFGLLGLGIIAPEYCQTYVQRQAEQTGTISLIQAKPTIVNKSGTLPAVQANPSSLVCQINTWLNQNPVLSVAGILAGYFLLRNKR